MARIFKGVAFWVVDTETTLWAEKARDALLRLEEASLPKAGKEGDIERYGVRYRTPEGLEEVVWGGDLRTAFNDSGAGVNDEVEILKIGRKTIEKGKAPMNLYKVRKLPSERIGAH